MLLLLAGFADTFTSIPNAAANAKLRIVLDSPQVRRLLTERGRLDIREHPGKYTAEQTSRT